MVGRASATVRPLPLRAEARYDGRWSVATVGRSVYLRRSMAGPASIFWDFNLPNSTTWFYFSFLLAVALFFEFGRGPSMRNWDVVTLFLLVPGLLLLQEARQGPSQQERNQAIRV